MNSSATDLQQLVMHLLHCLFHQCWCRNFHTSNRLTNNCTYLLQPRHTQSTCTVFRQQHKQASHYLICYIPSTSVASTPSLSVGHVSAASKQRHNQSHQTSSAQPNTSIKSGMKLITIPFSACRANLQISSSPASSSSDFVPGAGWQGADVAVLGDSCNGDDTAGSMQNFAHSVHCIAIIII